MNHPGAKLETQCEQTDALRELALAEQWEKVLAPALTHASNHELLEKAIDQLGAKMKIELVPYHVQRVVLYALNQSWKASRGVIAQTELCDPQFIAIHCIQAWVKQCKERCAQNAELQKVTELSEAIAKKAKEITREASYREACLRDGRDPDEEARAARIREALELPDRDDFDPNTTFAG